MKELLRTSSLSHAQGVKLALEAAGIEAMLQGQSLAGLLGDPFSVFVVDDGKLEQAQALVRGLEDPWGPA